MTTSTHFVNNYQLNLGTSSWTFKEWKGLFYPEKLPAKQYLSHYAQIFNSVEVNTSFYALPRLSTVEQWTAAVPDGFTFALKFPRSITHEKRLIDCEIETLDYLNLLRTMGNKAAPGLLQLPPSLTRQTSGAALAQYIVWLAQQLDGLRVAVEVRSPDLMTEKFITFLAQHGIALVLVDRITTPDLRSTWQTLAEAQQTPPFTFIRWIGNDQDGPTGNRELTHPQDDSLDEWASFLAKLCAVGHQVYGYMHNPYEGYSPGSLRRLQERLQRHVTLPDWPPAGSKGTIGVQGELFAL